MYWKDDFAWQRSRHLLREKQVGFVEELVVLREPRCLFQITCTPEPESRAQFNYVDLDAALW